MALNDFLVSSIRRHVMSLSHDTMRAIAVQVASELPNRTLEELRELIDHELQTRAGRSLHA